ncbi:MAG: hypothetical protein SWK90_12935 [Chloroflexota bacterium]|nr:hypothetical protein [Chloroflexota bacterium]
MAFAPDGTLWAISGGGLVHWDLGTDTYNRYLIHAGAIAVAPDGTLWLATDYGVCHFDGAACKNYTNADGLIHGSVRTVDVASDGAVWVGTEGGVSRFDGKSWSVYPSPVPITDLATAINGEVWVATSLGMGHYTPAQDAWTTYTEKRGLPSLQVQTVAAGPEGSVWVFVLWEGIYRFDGTNWQEAGEISDTVTDILLEPDGTPWVATSGGWHNPGGSLAYWDSSEWIKVASEDEMEPITSVALGPEGEIAAGTGLGLGIYQGGEWQLLRDGPAHDRVTSVAVTPDGAAWFAFGADASSTHYAGLSRFDGQAWQYFLDEIEVTALAVAPDGSLWAGTVNDVRRFDGVAWETVARCGEDMPVGSILDIAFTSDGAAWIANGFSLARFDDQSWTVYEKLAYSVVTAPDGDIWINGWEGRHGSFYVARFDGENWTTYKAADSFPGGFRVGAVTPDGRAWGITPERGLASFDGESWSDERDWTFYPTADSLSFNSVEAIAPDGALWLHTSEGFARFKVENRPDDRWTTYTADDGLVCDSSCGDAIAFAPDGTIWFGTTRFQPSQRGGVQ